MGDWRVGDLSWLTAKDIKVLNEKVTLTDDEAEMLEYLRRGNLTDDGIMLKMCLSRNKYYKIKGKIEDKIIKAAVQS